MGGGIRVAAFVSGGLIPAGLRGTTNNGIVHIADWYGTLCNLAGVGMEDELAAANGLPPVDSVDMWPFLSGKVNTSPRNVVPVQSDCLVQGEWKLVTDATKENFWQGPTYPNSTGQVAGAAEVSLDNCKGGCL